jgi:predicted nuclease of predicted toxin-antitoxin system
LRFLVDAQLPPALAEVLRRAGHEADHVAELGMATALDEQIWEEAIARSAVLVTKDSDFAVQRGASGEGPTILWIRIGNVGNRVLIARFLTAWPVLEGAIQRGERIIEFVGR